jgi:hypothetical protein
MILCLNLLYCSWSLSCLSICQFFFLYDKSNHIFSSASFFFSLTSSLLFVFSIIIKWKESKRFFIERKIRAKKRESEEKRNQEKMFVSGLHVSWLHLDELASSCLYLQSIISSRHTWLYTKLKMIHIKWKY